MIVCFYLNEVPEEVMVGKIGTGVACGWGLGLQKGSRGTFWGDDNV